MNENIDLDLLENQWEVLKIKSSEQNSFKHTDETYILVFDSESIFSIVLDVNHCTANYEIINRGEIIISSMSCTYLCCDSDFASELSSLLRKTTAYYCSGNRLFLEGEGEIVLKKIGV